MFGPTRLGQLYIFQKTENCREIMIKHKNMCACFKLFLLVNVFSEILMYFHMLPCNFVFAPHPHVCETYFNIFYVSLHALTCLHMFSTGFKGSMKTAAVFKTLHSPNVGFSSESRDQHFGCKREQLFGKNNLFTHLPANSRQATLPKGAVCPSRPRA